MAPEMLDAGVGPYDKSIDVWSIGLVLFQMLCRGRHAIKARNSTELCEQLKAYEFKPLPELSSEANSFLELLLKADPSQRPQPYQILTHPFLNKSNKIALCYSETLSCYEDQQVIMRALRGMLFLCWRKPCEDKPPTLAELPSLELKSSFRIRRALSPNEQLLKSLENPLEKPGKKKVQFEKACPARKTAE
jgi:serine/threonine protein kinase